MFALIVSVDYEGSDLLGIYSSLSRAVEAGRSYMDRDIIWGDTLAAYEVPVDADPRDVCLFATPAWSVRR